MNQPLALAGLKIVVTRPREQAAELARRIKQLGGESIVFPLLEITPLVDQQPLRAVVARLHEFDLAIFISPNAARYGMEAILATGQLPDSLRLATVGPGSARVLQELGVTTILAPQHRFDSEALLELHELQAIKGWRVAIFRGESGRELLGDTLKARGATVEYVACYQRSKPVQDITPLLEVTPDAITASSSEALGYLGEMLGTAWKKRFSTIPLFVPHARIAESAKKLGWHNVIVTAGADDGLLSGLVTWASERPNRSENTMSDQIQPPQSNHSEAGPGAAMVHNNPVSHAVARMNLTQLTLAVLLVIFLWQWFDAQHQINQMQQTLAQRLAEVDGTNKANQTLVLQDQEVVRELGGKLSLLETKFAETQNQRAALESLYQDLSSSRDQMVLAEVEQLLLIAGQQLQLAANVKAALIAMQQAESRLQRADRPALGGLRSMINRDMDKLRVLPNIDVSSINTRLDSLIAVVATLPLVQDTHTIEEEKAPETVSAQSTWQGLLHEIWQDTKHLVRIENMHKSELPLVSPSQTFFLRENVKLRLLSARLALLSRDEASFKRDIKTAQEWIKMYFDVKSVEGAQLLSSLQKLGASSISIDLPDISAGLEAVRHYRAAHEKGAR